MTLNIKKYSGKKSFIRSRQKPNKNHRCGFSLTQMLICLGIIVLLGAIAVPSVRSFTSTARRAQCDTRLKAIALGLNSFRQEQGCYPTDLTDLVSGKYYKEALSCPNDPRPTGSYAEYYVLRSPRDNHKLPVLVCPFHEADGRGAQAYVGSFTTQFLTRPAILEQANSVTVLRPGKNPIAGTAGMELRGGDRLQTSSSGMGKIRFADSSLAELSGGCDVTVLQSFINEQTDAPLHSLIRQQKGTATYTVNHGSRFEVVTPTTTAGALGTKFIITIDANNQTKLQVLDGKVYVSTLLRTALAPLGTVVNILPDLPGLPDLPSIKGILGL